MVSLYFACLFILIAETSDFDDEESADHEVKFMGMYLPHFVKLLVFSFFFSLHHCPPLYIYIYIYLYNPLMQSPFTLHVYSF